ncbi:hypothetical protein EMPS_08408 [Entomortierella parvispora]|uniref:RING-CH-type domain-containing protein n=1 Tax=Entomortierella parvispora TaxID=205924 RepID=A0A9P3HG27_9FUNG|nr:hypothetical protein EMPS_08408 [Entomortierella parvispora]
MDQQSRGHGPPADLQQVVSNDSDPEDYDGLMDEDWLDMDKLTEGASVSEGSSLSSSRPVSTTALDSDDDHRVPSLPLSAPLTLSIPSTTPTLLQEEAQHRQDTQTPGSASPAASSESEYSLLNPSADQSRKNSLSSVSGFHSLTPTDSRTDSDAASLAEQDLSSTMLDDMALDAGIPAIVSPSFSDFVQVGGSDGGQDDSLASESSSIGAGCDSIGNSGDSKSGDGSSQESTFSHVGSDPADYPTATATMAPTDEQGSSQQSQTSSPSVRRRTTYRTTVEDARTSSGEERTSFRKPSPRVHSTRTTVQEDQRSTSRTQVLSSTMPGGLNLGLDAEIPEYIPTGNTGGAAQVPMEERQCRICLGGADEEETLGRLISPCLCKGSMKYVHVECLNAWRTRSPKRESHYKCDTCKYSFSFRRTSLARYLAHPLSTFLLTIVTFALVVFGAGFAMKLLLYLTMDGSHEFIYPANLDEFDEDQLLQLKHDLVIFKTPETLRAVFRIDKSHMVFGSFFVSCIGFLQLLLSTIWMGGGGGVFRIGGFGLGGRRRGERQREGGIGGVVLMVALVFGLFKSVYMTYQFVNRVSRRVLEKAEMMVLEVQ